MWSCFKSSTKTEPQTGFFLLNGALLLENSIASSHGKSNPVSIFSAKQLEVATNNYNALHILRDDYNYTLYNGIIDDDRAIMVKKFKDYDTLFVQEAVNEVVIASQLNNHKKVLNLLGCCLQSKAPVLVFEFASNGALSDHIHAKSINHQPSHEALPWENRLRISVEIADAVTYLHMFQSNPIIHRNITSNNIFLDQRLGAKLYEFGFASRIPPGKTHVEAEVVGAFGFTAPESVITGQYTEKSDVFSFGAVLFELLTGKRAREIGMLREILNTLEAQNMRTTDTVTEMYLKANILQVGKIEQLKACAEIAVRCLKENPEERPAMKEVAQELRQITRL